MPNFNANQEPSSLFVGDTILVFSAETPAPPQASIAITLPPKGATPPAIEVEVIFGGAPGTFSVQIQESDTYADADFITPNVVPYTITAVNANNAARSDLIPTGGGAFLRVLLSSRTNAVTLTVKIRRLA